LQVVLITTADSAKLRATLSEAIANSLLPFAHSGDGSSEIGNRKSEMGNSFGPPKDRLNHAYRSALSRQQWPGNLYR
jgi:hypothetical protein